MIPGPLRLSVLVPGGRDPARPFPHGAGKPGSGHPPVNYHGYAACTHGAFFSRTRDAIREGNPVLLVLNRRLTGGLRALRKVQAAGLPVAITIKEAGRHQLAGLLSTPAEIQSLEAVCREAGAAIGSTPELAGLLAAMGCDAGCTRFVPTPYPVDFAEWDFSVSARDRTGIWIGTREFSVASRNHVLCLALARRLAMETGEPVTVVNVEGASGRKKLDALGFPSGLLRVIEGRRPYPVYLAAMAGHRLVLQLDRSGVPGQVAGDALLCRIPCLGGDGAVDRIAFGDPVFGEVEDAARRVLSLPGHSDVRMRDAMASAARQLSFAAVASALGALFQTRFSHASAA